jgi:hypothetical protein
MVLRCPELNKEVEIRIVGQLGTQDGIHTYGVAFVDFNLKFWDCDFPALSPVEIERGLVLLVCSSCKMLEKIGDTGMEADICATSEGVLRFCKRCGTTTFWKLAQPQTLPAVSQESLSHAGEVRVSLFPSSAPPALTPAPAPAASLPPAPFPEAPQLSFYDSGPPSPQIPATSQTSVDPTGSGLLVERLGAVLTLPPPSRELETTQVNRRKHARVKVSYSACIRHADRVDDLVTCEDMSRGGLRFKSHRRYFDRALIEVAVPYTPGQPAIFVPAQIVFIQELPEQHLFRYGVAYLQLPKAQQTFQARA